MKDMRENQVDGHIVHLNSTVGHKIVNIPDMNVYAASKYAVTALTETLRNELNGIGSKIKITVGIKLFLSRKEAITITSLGLKV